MPQYTLKTWIGIGILAIFQYFISMVIFLIVLARLDAIQASLCNYLIPFFGLVIAAVVLGERLTWYMILGGMLVLASTLLVTAYEERQRTKQESDTMPVRP
jgi:drug/metabolite transporter (DMT)-like permease